MIGRFNDSGDEYIIEKYDLKRPMFNYMWNDKIITATNHFGSGTDSYANITTNYIGEAGKERAILVGNGNRFFYVKDLETGKVWNPGWYPVREPLDGYSCTNGLGYTIIRGEKDNTEVCLTLSVSRDEPTEIWKAEITNKSDRKKSIALYPFIEFSLEGLVMKSDYIAWVDAKYIDGENMIYACNRYYEKPHEWYNGFIASDYKPESYETSKNKFLGRYGNISYPDAVKKERLSCEPSTSERVAGAFRQVFSVEKGETVTVHFVMGFGRNEAEAIRIKNKVLDREYLKTHFAALKIHSEVFNKSVINTPDCRINYFTNYWLKQQIQLCAEVGRAGKGFRDQLQDAWGVAPFNPKLAHDKIYETLQQIYKSGVCIRGWLPLKPWNTSDSPTWVGTSINAYLKETGDFDFLKEKVKYLDGGEDTVWEHILTTTRCSANDLGIHGLVLAHDGDWNDSLNMLGKNGRGESVWTTIALYYSAINIAEMAKYIVHDSEVEKEMLETARKLKTAVNEYGWDGEWYLAGYTDDGDKVGSHENEEGKIYLNSQIWAVFTGIADDDRIKKCMDSVEKYLESKNGALTLAPTYTKYDGSIGRLTGFTKGLWENGAPYCHGSSFKIIADCTIGDGDDAYRTVRKIMPDSAANPSEHSGAEPYVLTNMYYGPGNLREGETSFSWITGTAGWMYRSITQYMVGFVPGYESIEIKPCIPSSWENVSLVRQFREDVYRIDIENKSHKQSGAKEIYVDGKLIDGNKFGIFHDGKEHTIRVIM